MKKTYVNFASILVAALCLAFTACNGMTNSGETGTVQVFIGGGAARAVGGNGLPMFDGTNTTITVTDEDGELLAQGATSVVLNVAIGTKITVKAVVTTATGKWRDSQTHTVKPGVNNIDLKLSKTPKVAANLLFSMKKDASGSVLLSLNTADGTSLLNGISDNPKPVTARDKIGRVYVLYKDASSTPTRHLKRFDVEGIEDTAFSANFANALTAASISISAIDNIAIDRDEGYIFLFKDNTVYCFKEKDAHSFESFSSDGFPTVSASTKASAVAVGDKVLFAVYNDTLFACEFEFENPPAPGNKTLKFNTATSASANLEKLRANAGLFGNDLLECTGLFADDDEVYCLLTQQKYEAGRKYALGQLVRYEYSGSGSGYALTGKGMIGLHSEAAGSDSSLAFEAGAFSNPIGFIGYDEENIYIADDGVNIGYINENWRIKGNKNRIAAFNRKTKTLTFSETGATWYDEKPKYPSGTKTLLWGKDENQKFRYWIGEDGTETFLEGNKLFVSSSAEKPTDVFCYDQDGNLYIVWKDGSSHYIVRRFALKEDGSYNTQGTDTSSLTFFDISAIAVDISDGQNILYYAYKDTSPSASSSSGHIKKYSWVLGAAFGTGAVDNLYDVTFDADNASVTALAANKDGLFAGVKEKYQPGGTALYWLKIKKYKKTDGSPDGDLTLVAQGLETTNLSGVSIDLASFSETSYIKNGESINALQIFDGVLYALSSKSREIQKQDGGFPYYTDAFKSSGKLYKIGRTNGTLSGNAVVLAKKDWNDANKIGYGFYRFIAVKYDEAERIKFIIASDGAWDENGIAGKVSPPEVANGNTDRVLEYDLKGNLQAEREAGGSFSKTLMIGSGFDWN
jgi:hypothetical protein